MVKCAECGFLALYNRFTGVLDEAPLEDYRSDGHPPVLADVALASESYASLPVQPYKGAPTCFVQRHPLINEVKYTNGDIVPEAIKAVIESAIAPRLNIPQASNNGFEGSLPRNTARC